ncbi:MAG TPA: DUF2141 domain-containing protein [Allosphingosinicella sp.]|nr:DUF2141 domain-containing protein [Allosphingosinicella sp.]
MIDAILAAALLRPHLPSSPSLGIAEGRCRPAEPGPAIIVNVEGLKDRKGLLKLEVYPSNDQDFLVDDNLLIEQGKVFRRAEEPVPAHGPVALCVRVPQPGAYSLSLLHDRDSNRKFSFTSDGVGFPNNPSLGLSKPKAAAARVIAGAGRTSIDIVMNYRRGLLSFGPIGKAAQ